MNQQQSEVVANSVASGHAQEAALPLSPQTPVSAIPSGEPPQRQTRRYKKRLRFKNPPKPAIAVKELWTQASEADQERAHQQSVAVLSMWLGRKSKSDVAAELGLPGLRVWQLSQMALSGMLAGLLKQPKWRSREQRVMEASNGQDKELRELRLENAKLKQQLAEAEQLVSILSLWRKEPKPPEGATRPTAPPKETGQSESAEEKSPGHAARPGAKRRRAERGRENDRSVAPGEGPAAQG